MEHHFRAVLSVISTASVSTHMSASNMPYEKTDFFVVSNFFTYKKSPQPIVFVWDFKTVERANASCVMIESEEAIARQVATNKIVVRDRSVVEQFQN